jgi:hypothetical protein
MCYFCYFLWATHWSRNGRQVYRQISRRWLIHMLHNTPRVEKQYHPEIVPILTNLNTTMKAGWRREANVVAMYDPHASQAFIQHRNDQTRSKKYSTNHGLLKKFVKPSVLVFSHFLLRVGSRFWFERNWFEPPFENYSRKFSGKFKSTNQILYTEHWFTHPLGVLKICSRGFYTVITYEQ